MNYIAKVENKSALKEVKDLIVSKGFQVLGELGPLGILKIRGNKEDDIQELEELNVFKYIEKDQKVELL